MTYSFDLRDITDFLNNIKRCMETGKTVVLKDCKQIPLRTFTNLELLGLYKRVFMEDNDMNTYLSNKVLSRVITKWKYLSTKYLADAQTEKEYGKFLEFLSEPQIIERVDGNGVHLVPPEDDIAFGLSAMIAEDTSVEVTPSLQEMIWGSNTTALNSSGFISHLTTTIDLAKRSS
mgnify:CR=1 FL=1